jgi:hypothetical protein
VVGIVAQAFAHFLAVLGQDQAIDHAMLERRSSEEGRADHEQDVEQAPGLVQAFGDKVCRKAGLKRVATVAEAEADSLFRKTSSRPNYP